MTLAELAVDVAVSASALGRRMRRALDALIGGTLGGRCNRPVAWLADHEPGDRSYDVHLLNATVHHDRPPNLPEGRQRSPGRSSVARTFETGRVGEAVVDALASAAGEDSLGIEPNYEIVDPDATVAGSEPVRA